MIIRVLAGRLRNGTRMFRLVPQTGIGNGTFAATRALSVSFAHPKKVIPFILSDIGEGTKEVEIKEWFVQPGDMVEAFQELVEVQSDKATVPITSRYDGKIIKLYHDVDDIAQVGKPLYDIEIESEVDDEVDNYEDDHEVDKKDEIAEPEERVSTGKTSAKVKASPATRKFAAQNNIDLSQIVPTGKGGKVTKDDVNDAIRARDQPEVVQQVVQPVTDAKRPPKALPKSAVMTSGGGGRTEKLGPITKAMVKSMTEALKIPHFGYNEEYDVTQLVQTRAELKSIAAEYDIKLSYMPFIIKAVSMALMEFPVLNSTLSADLTEVTYLDSHNIGIATDTPHGLLVPNIKNVQNLSILEIAQELNRLHQAGLANKLTQNDIGGGTFALSNIGAIGGTYAKPVILTPQVAIGAIGRIQRKPRFDAAGAVVARDLTYISWTADHRIVEGAVMARFSNKVKQSLENPAAMLLNLR